MFIHVTEKKILYWKVVIGQKFFTLASIEVPKMKGIVRVETVGIVS